MSSSALRWKQGDTTPWPTMTATDAGGAVNLSSASTLTFKMWDSQGTAGTNKVSRAISGTEEVDLANGQWRFEPEADDVDTVGMYYFELEVTWADSTVVTFPQFNTSHGVPYEVVVIYRDL